MVNPSFSIIIPTYQRRELVCATVRTLCEIDYIGEAEVIVAVDGSTDDTAEALARLNCRFPLRVVVKENQGLAAARNAGAAEASKDILLFIDDDMIAEPDLLEHHARSYRAGADAVAGSFVEPGSPLGFRHEGIADRSFSQHEGIAGSPFGIFGGHFSVRRSAFQQVGGFDPAFTANGRYGYEDCDLAQRLLQYFVIHHNPNAMCRHRNLLRPRDYIRRARSSANAELYLLEKHPELQLQLSEWTGASRLGKWTRLLSRTPLLPQAFAGLAALVANLGLRTPLRSSRKLAYLCDVAYSLTYWSTVQRNGGMPSS